MALQASRPTQDQNFSVHFGGAPGVKTNGSKVQKKAGGVAGRKALNDISNSGKPAALQASRKHNSLNVIPVGEDLGVPKKSQLFVGENVKTVIKAPEKAQISGRKALGDLTNSVKPFVQQQGLKKSSRDKKLIAVTEEENLPPTIAEERFLHNHQECIKSQRRAMDMDQFLKIIGLEEDAPSHSHSVSARGPLQRKSNDESPTKLYEIEELPEPLIEDISCQSQKTELLLSGQSSPFWGSPKSPRLRDYDDFPGFILADSP